MDNTASNFSNLKKETNLTQVNENEPQRNFKRHFSEQIQVSNLLNNLSDNQDKKSLLNNELNPNELTQMNPPQKQIQLVSMDQNHFYESKVNHCYLEFMWKIDLTNETMLNSYIDVQTHKTRDGFEYLIGFIYFYNKASGNSAVIFAQKLGKQEVNKNEFYNEMVRIKNEIENELKKEKFEKIPINQEEEQNPIFIHSDNEIRIKNENNKENININVLQPLKEKEENELEQKEKEVKHDDSNELKEMKEGTESSVDGNYEEEEDEYEEEIEEEEEEDDEEINEEEDTRGNFVKGIPTKFGNPLERNIPMTNFSEKLNEIIYKKIIICNPNLFYNQYQQIPKNGNNPQHEVHITHPCFYISMAFFSPNKNSSTTEMLNITRPSKIMLSSFVIQNIDDSMMGHLTILIHQKMEKLKEISNDHIGLINEGMTCYMNSMIQSLNVLGYFKRGIFSMPYDNSENSLSYSLQRLFFDLTFERKPASTNKLVQSFGWSPDDIFIQHDVQEFNMMLSDLMEKKLKGTNNEEVFKFLFEGKICSKIECVDYEYESIKEEKFDDLQLNVKGCNDIYDSFNKYTEKEILDDDDKYEVEGHGKEKAIKSTTFSKFPPVLILQLKRFEYNPKLGSMDKVNDYFQFYEEIDLTKYLNNKDNDNNDNNIYKLLSVVVHKGNIYGGHYYAYTRFDVKHNNWYCFNDELVHKADVFEVFENNFGGIFSVVSYRHDTNSVFINKYKSDLSAYILIYIQSSKAKEILKPIKKEEVSSELIAKIYRDKLDEIVQMTLKARDVNHINVFYLNEFMLKDYHGLGIGKGFPKSNLTQIDHNKKSFKEESLLTSFITIPRTTTVSELYSIFIKLTGLSLREISLFLVVFNNSKKPQNIYFTMHFLEYYKQKPVENIMREFSERNRSPKRLVIFLDHSSMKTYEPIIQQYPPYDPTKFQRTEDNLIDEKKLCFNNSLEIFIPNSNPFVLYNIVSKCVKYDNYIKKLLIYKTLGTSYDFNIIKTLSVLVDERGGIEQSSIQLMKETEKEIINYYIKEYNITHEIVNQIGYLGIAYFIDKRCMEPSNGIFQQINSENVYELSYDENSFNLKFLDTSIMHFICDFNKMFFSNNFTDCLIIIPVLYRGSQLVGLNELINKYNTNSNYNKNKVNQELLE